MKKDKTSFGIICRGIAKNKVCLAVFFVTMTICFILLPLIPMYSTAVDRIRYYDEEKTYGSFDLVTFDMDVASKIGSSSFTEIISTCFFRFETEECYGGRYASFYYSTESILDMTEYLLSRGRFPEKDGEAACEAWMLRQLGLSSGEMLGAVIEIGDLQLEVTGIVEADTSGTGIDTSSAGTVFMWADSGYTGVFIDLSPEVDPTDFLRKSGFSDQDFYTNLVKSYVRESRDDGKAVMLFIFGISVMSSFLVIYNIAVFVIEKNRQDFISMIKIGIPERRIKGALFSLLGIFLWIPAGILGVLTDFLAAAAFSLKFKGVNGFEIITSFSSIICFSVVWFSAIAAVSCAVVFFGRKRELRIKSGRSRNVGNTAPVFFRASANNLRSAPLVTISAVLSLSAVLIFSNVTLFYLKAQTSQLVDYGDVEYVVSFDTLAAYTPDTETERREITENLLSDPALESEQVRLAVSKISIDKSAIGKRFADLLRFDSLFNAAYNNNLTRMVPVFVGYTTVSSLKNSSDKPLPELSDDEGLILAKPYNCSFEGFSGVSDISAETQVGEISFKVMDFELACSFYSNDVFAVAVVSDAVFEKLSSGLFSAPVYIHGNVSEDYLLHSISNLLLVRVEPVKEIENEMREGMERTNRIMVVLFIIAAVYSMVCLTVTCLMREILNGKEYATLNAMGIPLRKILRIPAYEYAVVLLSVIIFSGAGVFFGSSIVVLLSESEVIKRLTPFPTGSFLVGVGLLACLSLVCAAISILSLRKESAIATVVRR